MTKRWTFTSGAAQIQISRILKAIEKTPMTCEEIGKAIHLSETTVTVYIRYLTNLQPKQVYVKKWKRIERVEHAGFQYVRAWMVGDKRNAVRPKPLTVQQRSRRYLKKVQADPVAHAQRCAGLRLRRLKPHADPFTSLHWGKAA